MIGLQAKFAIPVFRPSLRIKCTSVVYWSFFRVDFADPVHGSILLVSLGSNLWTYEMASQIEITGPFFRSNLMAEFTS